MGSFAWRITKIAVFVFFISAVTISLLKYDKVLFPNVGEPAAAYDCDDAALDMYRHFEELGIESTPIVGNLDITGETYMQSNHVWLLVKSGGCQVAYDWGTPRFDRQHYEGYEITLDYLLYAVEQDKKAPGLLGIAENEKLD